jgi:hypothetical protein
VPLLDENQLRERITRLAAIERGSASAGEHQAAELIAEELRSLGARVALEEEEAHGTYWWPIGVLTGVAALAGFLRSRLLGLTAGAFAATGVADDITAGSHWFRKRFLPRRTTVNVVAEVGPADAGRTIVFVAHHDAAHAGLVFHPELPRAIGRRFPEALERTNTTPGTMWGGFWGPVLVAAGSLLGLRWLRRLGATVSAGYTVAMVDIGVRGVVPGANDNLSGVGVLLSLAHAIADGDGPPIRVLLVSTGSEESFMEGMRGFADRHFPSLPTDTTHFLCVDTVGSPTLLLLEGEGMLGMREYPKDVLGLLKRAAAELGIDYVPNLRFRNATDGLIALKAGYPSAMIGSVDEYKAPTNYHWPTDTAENVDYSTVAEAGRLCLRLAELVAELPAPDRGPVASVTPLAP